MKTYKINEFEKIASEDLNDIQSAIHQSLYDKILYPFFQKKDGFLADGFSVARLTDNQVSVKAGRGFFYDEDQQDPNPKYQAMQLNEDLTLTVGAGGWPANPVTQDRIDIIVVRPKTVIVETQQRYVKTAGTGPIVQQEVDKILEQQYELQIVSGVESMTPAAPATPAGWLKIAEVTLWYDQGIANAESVADTRTELAPTADTFSNPWKEISFADEPYTASALDRNILVDTTDGMVGIMLPNESTHAGTEITIERVGSGDNGAYIRQSSGMIFDYLDTNHMVGVYKCDGTKWMLVGGDGKPQLINTVPMYFPLTLMTAQDRAIVFVDTNDLRSIRIPDAALCSEFTFIDMHGLAATNPFEIQPTGADKIQGLNAPFVCEDNFGSWKFISNKTDWFLVK